MKNIFETKELWFVTGSQHLYGDEVLKKVEENSKRIAEGLSAAEEIPVEIRFKNVVTTAKEIKNVVGKLNIFSNIKLFFLKKFYKLNLLIQKEKVERILKQVS